MSYVETDVIDLLAHSSPFVQLDTVSCIHNFIIIFICIDLRRVLLQRNPKVEKYLPHHVRPVLDQLVPGILPGAVCDSRPTTPVFQV